MYISYQFINCFTLGLLCINEVLNADVYISRKMPLLLGVEKFVDIQESTLCLGRKYFRPQEI